MPSEKFSLRVGHAILYEDNARWNHLINLYPYNTVYFVLGGDGFVRIEEITTRLRPGHMYLIPANTLYSCWCESYIHKLYVEFYLDFAPGEDVFSGYHGRIAELPFPEADIRALCACLSRATLREQLLFEGQLLSALSLFADEASQKPVKDLMRFKAILHDIAHNLSGDLRLCEVAERHGWNPSTLSREFHKAFGCTMKQYAGRLLVNALRQELLLTDKTLCDLATEYHFCDAYYLSAFFKRYIGIAPDLYRKQNVQQEMRT